MGRPATLKIDILADAKGVGKGVAEAEGAFGKLGGAAKLGGLAVAAGLAVVAGASVKLGLSAIKAASDAEQSMGAVESVFGDASKAVQTFAKTSADRLGLSQNSYRELAAVVGAQLKNMGKSQAEASVESDKLISLGADLAATFGGSVSEAVGAVGSLLRGERDPIERYGVAIKDADIKARLAADGQDKLSGAALKTATAQATLSLLTEQTSGSLGAFGRESDTLAGKQARLQAKVEDVKTALGERLLPIATRFVGYLLDHGVPALERGIEKFDQNRAAIGNFAVGVGKAVLSITEGFLRFLQGVLTVFAKATAAYDVFVGAVFGYARSILKAMESSLGWLPGFENKFQAAGIALDVYEKTTRSKIGGASDAFQKGANVAGVAAGAVGGLKEKIDALRPKTVEAKADVRGETDVNNLGNAVRRLNDKTITVTTIHRNVTIAERDGKGGGLQAAAGGLYGMVPSVTPAQLGGLLTAAAGDGSFGLSLLRRTGPAATVVDARTIDASIRLEAMSIDERVVDRLERAMREQAVRLGRSTAYGAA